MLLMLITPEDTKNIAIVTVMLAAIAGALLLPIARAYARRLEKGGSVDAVRNELAEVHARLDALQQNESRVAELEARLDFAERMLTRQREAEPMRLPPG